MLKNELKKLLNKPFFEWEKFHQKTKRQNIGGFLPSEQWPKSWTTTYFKDYPRLDKIVLPSPLHLEEITLEKAIDSRRSLRRFSSKPLSLQQLSDILFYSSGLRDNSPPWKINRPYPSPGARYPIEIYIVSLNSELPIGVYHYNLRSHSLESLVLMEKFDQSEYLGQDWINDSSIVILMTAVFERNTIKYGELGYRHVLQESGHIGQNFYLVATTLNIAICGAGGYIDDKLNKLLDIDGIKETVVYALVLGNKLQVNRKNRKP